MAQELSIEDPDTVWLITTRTKESKLWFVNNKPLEEAILGYLAKYQEKYGVILYGFVIMGNHIHILARFPNWNRAHFMRDLNARTAHMVKRHVPSFPHQMGLWARRYTKQAVLIDCGAVEHYFFYLALQSVYSGLSLNPDSYPGYNSFRQAARCQTTQHEVFDWAAYNDALRYNPKADPKDFVSIHNLTFSKLPRYEQLPDEEYQRIMFEKREQKRKEAEEEARRQGHRFKLPAKALTRTKPGTKPKHTKLSHRHSHRPLVLTFCKKARKEYLDQYFALRKEYDRAVERYLRGEDGIEFPRGAYRPPGGMMLRD